MMQIAGDGKRDPWSVASQRGIRHYVTLQLFEKRDARVFASAAVRTQFVIGLWLEDNAKTLSADWISIAVEIHARNSNARKIAARNEPGKKVESSIRTSCGRGIQNALNFISISGLRLHDYPETL
jgi:hypothetical protein